MSASGEKTNHSTKIRWLAFALIAVGGTAVDLLTKQWIFQWRGLPGQMPEWWIVEPYFGIETAVNPGALFGMGAGWGLGFAALSVLAAIAVIVWLFRFRAIESRWLVTSLGFVTGGIFGNLYDRLGLWNPPENVPEWSSGVRDWILFRYGEYTWPNFNIADSLLVCGAIMLAVHSIFVAETEEESAESKDKASKTS
ncbi:MAG: signal peptidase II [Planctomycetota bacterium]|nr:signal peptidase II [Planctomycetota bacterium]